MPAMDTMALSTLLEGDMIPGNLSPFPMPICGLKSPEQATAEDVIVLMDTRWLAGVEASAAAVVVCEQKLWQGLDMGLRDRVLTGKHVILVPDGRAAFVRLLHCFYPESPWTPEHHASAVIESEHCHPLTQIGALAFVARGARIGEGTRIAAQAQIGRDVVLGQNCRIGERVVLCDGVRLGDRVVIHAGTVVGSDGYGFYRDASGQHQKIPQVGSVYIGNDVEIGANVTIDRGTLGDTVIGEGTKIDNLVQIGHNVRLGKRCLIVAQVGISGSTVVGNDVILAGQTGVAGHLTLGDGVIASGKAGITRDIPAGQHVSGHPAMEHRAYLRWQAALKQWPRWFQTLKRQWPPSAEK